MRRRQNARRTLTADEVVELMHGVEANHTTASLEVRNHAVREALAEYGYTPLDGLRARFWIRRGRPADYHWDQ